MNLEEHNVLMIKLDLKLQTNSLMPTYLLKEQ